MITEAGMEACGCSRGRPPEARGTWSFRRELSPADTLMLDFRSPAWKGVNICYSQPSCLRMFVTAAVGDASGSCTWRGLEGTPELLTGGIP